MPAVCRDCCTFDTAPLPRLASCGVCGSTRILVHHELAILAIAHVDCDAFYASVEKRDRPEIRDQPLIVGHPGGRGVVTTACYIARRFGVRSAMPMFQALERCPHAVVIAARHGQVQGASASQIRAIFAPATADHRAGVAGRGLSRPRPEHRTAATGPPAQSLARIAPRDRGRGRHHRVDRARRRTSSWPSSPPSARSRAASR